MTKEIERKFLVDRTHPDVTALLATPADDIRQGYIMSGPTGVVRVRISNDAAFLTIKGVTVDISRDEFEYPIPMDHAERLLLTMCGQVIEKQRYFYPLGKGLVAELDVFPQIDLYVAEVELSAETDEFAKPDWFGEEVSADPSYFNNNIADRIEAANAG